MKFNMGVRIFLCLVLAPFAAHALPKTAGGPGGVGTIDGTSKLVVWLQPDNTATNGQITGVLSPADPWSDSSGNANHFDYFNGSQRPQWTNSAINGQAAVAFDGTDTLRMAAAGAYADTDAETVFVVWDRDDNATEDAVLGCQNHNNNVYALYKKTDGWNWLMSGGSGGQSVRDAGHGVTTDGLQMIVGVSSLNLGSIALYDQGGLLKSSSFTTPSPSARRYDLADTGSQALDGLIAEFVAFKTNLNTVQRYLVENYLSSKFDMTLTDRDFYAGDTAGNGDYDFDVCGVGQDGSTQVTNGGMSGFGILATAGLDDADWVLAGHNLEFDNCLVATEVPAGMVQRWRRVWYLDKTGNLDVTLAFDHSDSSLAAPAGGADFALLYSATQNPYNFTTQAIAESVSGDTVSFAVADANLLDGYYTLATDEAAPVVFPATAGGPGGVGTTDGTSEMIMWLKPDPGRTNGEPVGPSVADPWVDSSGFGNNVRNTSASPLPVNRTNAINGQAAVEFDGVNDNLFSVLQVLAVDTSNETVFVVHDRDDEDDSDAPLGNANTGNYGLYQNVADDRWNWLVSGAAGGSSAITDAGPVTKVTNLTMIVGVRSISGNSIALYDQDGTVGSTTHSVPPGNMNYYIGRRAGGGGDHYDGLIAEVVAFKTNLNTVQRYLVENYLCSKYDMTLTGRDFYAGDTAGNGDYDADVFGVGQDGSTQVTNGGMSGFGIQATFALDDGDWVLAGNNLEFENNRVKSDVPAGMKRRWQRVWYLDKTGNVNVSLGFDHSDALLSAPTGGTDFALLYSATQNPYNFTTQAIAESVSGDTVSFAVPKADLVDGYYTLASDEDIPVVSDVTAGGPGGVGTIDGTSKLVVWLKPDNTATNGQPAGDASPSEPWSDSSGNANDFDYFDDSKVPQWTNSAINGQAAVAFDGTDTVRMPAGGAYAETDAETVFVVWDRDDNATEDAVLGCQSHNNNVYALYKKTDGWNWLMSGGSGGQSVRDAGHGVTTDGLQMIVGVSSIDLGSIALYDQGGLLKSSSFTTPSPSARRYDLADTGSQALDGLIAEFVAFKTNLTTVQRYLVENNLCSKYDMTLTDRDFYAGDTGGNDDYDCDVFGIGRLSSSDEVTSAGLEGLGIAAQWESLGDDEWILAGHKVTNNVLVSLEGGNVDSRRWARVWYVDVTGTLDARMSFDFSDSGLAQQGANYVLLYSATSAFSWSTVVDADASVDGDRLNFDVAAACMVDGYYTTGFISSEGTMVILQ